MDLHVPPQGHCGIFPTFFHGGFECATAINSDGARLDELRDTGHDLRVLHDYHALASAGIRVAREGIRWNLVDRRGILDFSSVIPFVDAAAAANITCIWDLFHYGYPDDLDPFRPVFVERFAAYCAGVARLLRARGYGERERRPARYYTPVNEISFFAWAGGEVGMFAPFERGRAAELKRALVVAAIAGIDAIRAVDPLARFVHCDPLTHVVAPADAPEMAAAADAFNARYVCEAWDMLAGRIAPELGGSPAHLDILGVNYYGVNQWELGRAGALARDDPRRKPFHRMLVDLYARYEHPVVVTETSSIDEDRPRWLQHITSECLRAMRRGVDLHGICVYPVVGMCDWYSKDWRCMGLWDCHGAGNLARRPHEASLVALRKAQQAVARHFRRAPAPGATNQHPGVRSSRHA